MLPPAILTQADREALLAAIKKFGNRDAQVHMSIELDVVEGSPAVAILARAEAMPADLLVMGTHGRSGFEHLVLGSITENVVRKATCAVLTVPSGIPGAAAPAVPFKHIICAVDFSDCSMQALNYAMSLAQEADAQLTVMHVIELPPDMPREAHENVVSWSRHFPEYVAAAEEDRRRRLRDAIPDNVRAYCTVDTVLATGKPYREVLRVAHERNADLLVVGVHGRGAIDQLLFGSTTQHLVRQALCPVLTIR